MAEPLQTLLGQREAFIGFLRKQGSDLAQAEDLLQAALLRGLEPWTHLPPEDRLVAWFYRVLHNAVIDQFRRDSVASRALEQFAHERPDVAPEAARRVCRCTGRVLELLKPEYASLVQHVDIQGLPLADAARRAGISTNNAYVRLHRARKALRARMHVECGSCATGTSPCSDCYCGVDLAEAGAKTPQV